jgi:hypothetical protein
VVVKAIDSVPEEFDSVPEEFVLKFEYSSSAFGIH